MLVNSKRRLESSQQIPPLRYLDDSERNTEFFKKLAKRNLSTSFIIQGETVYRSTLPGKAYEFFCLDFENRKVLYFSQLSVSDNRCFLHHSLRKNRQSYVWADDLFRLSHPAFARQCLWQLLFPLVPNILISDREQTNYGYNFWEILVREGIIQNYCVIAFVCKPSTKERYYTRFTHTSDVYANIEKLKKLLFGKDIEYQNRGFAICRNDITDLLEKDTRVTELSLDEFLKLDI